MTGPPHPMRFDELMDALERLRRRVRVLDELIVQPNLRETGLRVGVVRYDVVCVGAPHVKGQPFRDALCVALGKEYTERPPGRLSRIWPDVSETRARDKPNVVVLGADLIALGQRDAFEIALLSNGFVLSIDEDLKHARFIWCRNKTKGGDPQ